MADLATVDIPGVEILASGGPVYAIGSPPDGDFYTREELEGIAAAHHELGDEIRAPIKIGHSDRQQLAANSGLTEGEMPALGWLDNTSFRVEDDESGVAKLIADAKAVPAKLAELMRTGAYRTRSSEIRKYASQKTQKSYDWVVEGLALMGAKVPAIQTLDDVYRLYERAGIDKPDADTYVIRRHAAGDVVWNVEDGLEDLRCDLNDALNPAGYNLPVVPQLWVRDIARSSNVALVSSGYGDDDDAWVVPFTIGDDGEPVPASRDQWIAADQTWVAATNELERRQFAAWDTKYVNGLPDSAFLYVEPGGTKDDDGKTVPRANRHFPYKDDSGAVDLPHLRNALARIPQSSLSDSLKTSLTTKAQGILAAATKKNSRSAESRPMELTLTDDQVTAVREQLGLAADAELTADTIVEAAEARANELAAAKTAAEEASRKLESDETSEQLRKLEADLETEKRRSFEQRRDADIKEALRTRELEPADVQKWQKRYEDLGEETARELMFELPKRETVRELGSDDGDPEELDDEAYAREFERLHGMKARV